MSDTAYNRARAHYRMPRENGQPSRVLLLTWNGTEAWMSGGKFGSHRVTTSDPKEVAAHWAGYATNNRGRETKPAIQHWSVK